MLAEMPEVAELHPVPDAHVPVMKFKFMGVSIDLLYAKLALLVVPDVCLLLILLWLCLEWYRELFLQKFVYSDMY
jgi:poly(A) polymerase Pap1